MASNKESVRNFIAMWDNMGLECIFDVDAEMAQRDAYNKNKVWKILKGEKVDEQYRSSIPLKTLILRARANSQRHYEIYQFTTDGIDMDDLKSMFEDSPQFLVNHIRKNGRKIYSDRFEIKSVIV